MKAIVSGRYGPPDALELRDVDTPALEPHQVLVRVVRQPGRVVPRARAVLRPAAERPLASAQAASRGDRPRGTGRGRRHRREFQPGDEVFGTRLSAWAEYAVAREPRLVEPANVSWEEAAAIPIAAITALQALRDHGHVQPGQKVLINGAAGGVGTYAVQLASGSERT